MKRVRTYSPVTVEAARLLGARVQQARRERRWTLQELADRVGVTHVTMRQVERGELTVGVLPQAVRKPAAVDDDF
jgi:transcriptional regulator with XRE-family HTH domain